MAAPDDPAPKNLDDVPGKVDADLDRMWVTVDNLVDGFVALLPKLAIAVAVFVAMWLAAKGVRALIRRATKDGKRANLGQVLARLAYFTLLILGLLVSVTIVAPSVTPGKLLSVLGIGGVAIGFAFKDIFQNMLAGILILLRQPFQIGDEITSGGFTGTVEAIETRATFLRSYDGRRIIVPNSQIYTDPVVVITAYGKVRSQHDIGIGCGDDIAEARRVALKAVAACEGVLDDPGPDALTWALGDFAVILRVRWWTEGHRGAVVQARDRVLEAVFDAFNEAAIDMPYPTAVTLFHDQTEATDGDRRKQREGWPAGEHSPEPRTIAGAMRGRDMPDGDTASNDTASNDTADNREADGTHPAAS